MLQVKQHVIKDNPESQKADRMPELESRFKVRALEKRLFCLKAVFISAEHFIQIILHFFKKTQSTLAQPNSK